MKKILILGSLILITAGCQQIDTDTTNNDPSREAQTILGNAISDAEDISQFAKERTEKINKELDLDSDLKLKNDANIKYPRVLEDGNIEMKPLMQKIDSAILQTNFGDIIVKFYAEDSPTIVNNFLNLADSKFYDGTKFHRVISDFMIQGGDPLSKDDNWADDGTGGPEYRLKDEFNSHKLVRGSLAMANSGPNTNGSQFFIVTRKDTPHLDGRHTNFGYVVEGMDVVDKIEAVETNGKDHPTTDVIIETVKLIYSN